MPAAFWRTLESIKAHWVADQIDSTLRRTRRRPSSLFASDGAAADPYLQCIHHAVLRLMVQRMEANYGELDQTCCAALHAWPHGLLRHNLAAEAFFFPPFFIYLFIFIYLCNKLNPTPSSQEAVILIKPDGGSGWWVIRPSLCTV